MNVAWMLAEGATRAGGAPAVISGDRTTSYPQLLDRVARLAAGLRRLGLRRGDRVVLLLPNAPELVEALWASLWGGFVAVPLNWHLHPDEVGYVVRHCAAAAIVVAEETLPATAGLPAGVTVIRTPFPPGLLTGDRDDLAGVAGQDPAWLFYTSGTTGRPKGATLTHRNLRAMTAAYHADLDPVAPGSVYLHAAPLTHGSGLYLLPATAHGATHVIAPGLRFAPDEYLALIERRRVTHAAFLAPTMLKRVLDAVDGHDLSTLRSVVVSGAPLYQEDLRAAVAVLGPIVTEIYGQGESR
ncbi:class I adenylate-forming enzyme family protein [Dactylosporangium cerinum]|uniref:Class I adenylate-forming enzyme family protein n=1 Tax=Dactylosporangium cerinum TaxID=1434730 RepID=A0ABV9W119_9ACTN